MGKYDHLIGKEIENGYWSWDSDKALLYAVGVGAGLPDPLIGCRYHSLIVEEATLPEELEVTARTESGLVMALQHRRFPLVGVQFHPESILTDAGYPLLAAFLRLAGLPVPHPLPTLESEL